MRSVEIFSGAGGLAIGISVAGFQHDAVVEKDQAAYATLRENKFKGTKPIANWPIFNDDIKKFDYSVIPEGVDLLAGGPPCQPFSIGGKHRGSQDQRNLFPEAVRALRELRPRAFIFENVRGLMRASFSAYFEYIKLQLTYPMLAREKDQEWTTHLIQLQRHHTSSPHKGLHYNVVTDHLNAVDFGVPQKRDRVFFVGFRSDLDVRWSFPVATHTEEALLWSQWVTGEYWDIHRVAKKLRPAVTTKLRLRIAALRSEGASGQCKRWQTVRDAIGNLPDPTERQASLIPNHKFQPGARVYAGHTGSPLDEPSKTLKAGDHGVPGGENMLVLPSGKVRYFTVRESARLQTFHDDIFFPCSWTESMRQLGNAVPVTLAKVVAESVAETLLPTHRKHDRSVQSS